MDDTAFLTRMLLRDHEVAQMAIDARALTHADLRFGNIFSVLGQLPDGFEDQWIDAVLRDRQAVKNFSQRVEQVRPPMELRYTRYVADDQGLDWEYTEAVLSSRDLDEWMRQGW